MTFYYCSRKVIHSLLIISLIATKMMLSKNNLLKFRNFCSEYNDFSFIERHFYIIHKKNLILFDFIWANLGQMLNFSLYFIAKFCYEKYSMFLYIQNSEFQIIWLILVVFFFTLLKFVLKFIAQWGHDYFLGVSLRL